MISSLLALALLQGTWVQSCQQGGQRTEIFHGTTATLVESSSRTSDCSDPDSTLASSGTIRIGDGASNAMDFSFESVTLTLRHEDQAQLYSENRVCGFADWKAGEGKVITGLACDLWLTGHPVRIPGKGFMRYGIFAIDLKSSPEELRFGFLSLDRDGSTPEKRPTQLERLGYVKASR